MWRCVYPWGTWQPTDLPSLEVQPSGGLIVDGSLLTSPAFATAFQSLVGENVFAESTTTAAPAVDTEPEADQDDSSVPESAPADGPQL